MDDLFGWLGSVFNGGGGGNPGGLTPDQQQMLTQQGWYPRPDMVMPTGSLMTQPQGYSGLTPAQASTVNGIGYYTDPGAQQQPEGLLGKLKGLAGDPGIADLQKAAAGMSPQALPQRNLPLPTPHIGGLLNPYHNLYTPNTLDPKLSLQRFQRGY